MSSVKFNIEGKEAYRLPILSPRNIKTCLTGRKSINGLTESSDLYSTKLTIKQSNFMRPSIYLDNSSNFNLMKNKEPRRDAYGHIIQKGGKDHKVSFMDNVSSQKMVEVILIKTTESNGNNEKKQTICTCSGCLII